MGSRLAGEGSEPAQDPVARRRRATDDENRVVSADGSQDVGPTFPVERGGDRLGAAGNRAQDDHLTDSVHTKKQLRQQRIESGATFLDTAIRYGVARALG